MKLEEFIKKRDYIKSTINTFAESVKGSELDAYHNVVMSVKKAENVARCLGWLEAIFDSIYETGEINNVDISYALDEVYSDDKYL